MEKEGLSRGLNFLEEKELTVKLLVTDRHKQIAAWMRSDWPDINHRYDVWHLAKCTLHNNLYS
jgi:solute carrier family 8 (sodium/calcium exchanger)